MLHFPHVFVTVRGLWTVLYLMCSALLRVLLFSLLPILGIWFLLAHALSGSCLHAARAAFSRLCDQIPNLSHRHEKTVLKCTVGAVGTIIIAFLIATWIIFDNLHVLTSWSHAPNFTTSFYASSYPPVVETVNKCALVTVGSTCNISFRITSKIGIDTISLNWKGPTGEPSYQQICKTLQLAPESTPYDALYSTSCFISQSWQLLGNFTLAVLVRDHSCITFEAILGDVTLSLPATIPQPDALFLLSVNGSTGGTNKTWTISTMCKDDESPDHPVLLSCGLAYSPLATLVLQPSCSSSPTDLVRFPGIVSEASFSNVQLSCDSPPRLAPITDFLCNAGSGCQSAGDSNAQCQRKLKNAAIVYECRCSVSFIGPYCVLAIDEQYHSLVNSHNKSFRKDLLWEFEYTSNSFSNIRFEDSRDSSAVGNAPCPFRLRVSHHCIVRGRKVTECLNPSLYSSHRLELFGAMGQMFTLAESVRDYFNVSSHGSTSESCETCGGFMGSCPISCNPLTPHLCLQECPLALCYKCDACRSLLTKMSEYVGVVPELDKLRIWKSEKHLSSFFSAAKPTASNVTLRMHSSAGNFAAVSSSDPNCWTTFYTGLYYLHFALQSVLFFIIMPLMWVLFGVFICEQMFSATEDHVVVHQKLRTCSHCMRGKLRPDNPCLVRCCNGHPIHRVCLDHLISKQLKFPYAPLHYYIASTQVTNVTCPLCSPYSKPHFTPKNICCDGGGAAGHAAAVLKTIFRVDGDTSVSSSNTVLSANTRRVSFELFAVLSNRLSAAAMNSRWCNFSICSRKTSNTIPSEFCFNKGSSRKQMLGSIQFVSAAEKLGEGCAMGNTRCMAELSWILCHGRLGLKKQPSRAFELASLGVQTNCPDSMAALSKCLADGCGCEKNLPRSLALAEQSAAAGSRLGHYQLGQLNYNSANFISSKYFLIDNPAMDIAVAVQHFTLAAAQNMPSALVKLGFLREQGCVALPLDHSQAVSLYHAATAFGHPDAYMRLALCYERGRGVPSDRQKAIELYILAHRAGFHDTDRIRHRLFLLNAVIPPPPSSKFTAAFSASARLVGASIRPLQWLFGLLSRPLAWLSTKYPSLGGWVAATLKFTAVSAGMVPICCDLVRRDYTLASELSIVPRLFVMSPWLIPTYAFVYELLKSRPSHFLVWLRARSITQLGQFVVIFGLLLLILDFPLHQYYIERWSGPPFDAVVFVRIFLDQCYAYMIAAFWYFRYIRPLF